MVRSILGGENSQERFNVYFNWYNIVHEVGHIIDRHYGRNVMENGLLEAELFANAFAVAFWAHYGDEETFNLLKELVPYAVENFERPVSENEGIAEVASLFEAGELDFTFNNYGWFQFSLVNFVLEEKQDLESLLIDAGLEFVNLPPKRTLEFSSIGEEAIPEILVEVFTALLEWGIEMPFSVYHMLDDDPNIHMVVPGFTFEEIESWGIPTDKAVQIWPTNVH